MERERRPSEAEQQYELFQGGEAIDQEHLFSLDPNYMHLMGMLIDQGEAEQVLIHKDDGTDGFILRLRRDDVRETSGNNQP